jgi:hypothetical protein
MQLQAVRTLTVRGQSQGLDKVKADLDAVSASQQGVAQSSTAMATASETSARRQLSAAGAFERLIERNDRMVYIQRQLEREMNIVNRAHEQGAIDATRHASAVDMVTQKYQRLAAAEMQARAATDAQAAATIRLAAANDNVRAHSFNTGNVAAQFQDIGVTAMMGQSPLTIALQQGTQLSAVLGGQGLTGIVRTLGAAFLSIVNPVSLITIGVVGLAAAGIQAFTSMTQDAEESTKALEKHKEWLDKILAGYDAARDAANGARDAAVRLPEGAVLADLQGDLKQQEEQRQALQRRIDDTKANLAYIAELYAGLGRTGGEGNVMGGIAVQIEGIRQLGVSAASSSDELDAATVAASKLFNEADDPTVKDLANQVYTLAKELRAATGEINATTNAIVVMQQQAAKGFDIGDTLSQITSLTPELRSPKEQVADLFEKGAAAARTTGQLQNLADAAKKAYDAIDKQEAQRAAERAATASTNAINQQAEAYKNLTTSIDDRIAKAEFEVSVLGMTEDAAAKLRVEFELMQQAKSAGIGLDPDVMARAVDKIAEAEKKVRDTNKALTDQKRIMDQLAGSAQTLVGSLMGATGMSDTPLGGAVNGALGSLMKGDWIGALIGGVTGLFVGFIEQEKKHQEAIKAANDNRPAIEAFIDTGYGREIDETTAAVQRFKAQAEQYIKLAQAAGDQGLINRLRQAEAAYKNTLKAQSARDDFTTIRDDLIDTYKAQADSIQSVIDRTRDFIAANDNYRDSLLVDKQYSTLSPQRLLEETQKQFDMLVSKAGMGDANAQSRLSGASDSYLDAARGYYGSTSNYSDIFDRVQQALGSVSTAAGTQLSAAQQQLEATNRVVSSISGVDNSVKTVASLMQQLNQLQAEVSKLRGQEAKELRQEIKELKRIIKNSDLARAA